MAKKKKYLTGGQIPSPFASPSQELQQGRINSAQAQFRAASNPFVLGLEGLGQLGMQFGMNQESFGDVFSNDAGGGKANALKALLGFGASFATGGDVGARKVNVEGGELAELPNGNLMKFFGPKHEQDGIDTELPPGSTVFSDRFGKDGESYAKRKENREKREAKLNERLSETPHDSILKNTLKRIKTTNEAEDKEDRDIQNVMHLLSGEGGQESFMTGGDIDSDFLRFLQGLNLPTQERGEVSLNDDDIPGTFALNNLPIPNIGIGDNNVLTAPTLPGVGLNTPQKRQGLQFPNITTGNAVGLSGNLISTFGPLLNTLKGRAEDTPNINAFENFGNDGLETLQGNVNLLGESRDNQLTGARLSRNGLQNRLRNSARGVNTRRALDISTTQVADRNERGIQNNFLKSLLGVNNSIAQQQNLQDQMFSRGEQARDLADRQDKGAFRSDLAQNIEGMGRGLQETGFDLNAIENTQQLQKLLANLSTNFKFDKKGNLIRK